MLEPSAGGEPPDRALRARAIGEVDAAASRGQTEAMIAERSEMAKFDDEVRDA